MKRHARTAYEAVESTLTLFEASRPRRGAAFDVPSVRPGRYMVQIYDGTEGGSHYTWGFFTVADHGSLPVTGRPDLRWLASALLALGMALVMGSNLRAKPRPSFRSRSKAVGTD